MRSFKAFALATAALLLVFGNLFADYDYLTKDGELTQPLKITQLQGGFAGFTGMRWSIAVDGTWTSESLFNQKATPKDKGKLSKADLAKLGDLLDKNEVPELPKQAGKKVGANPHTITIEFGKDIATYTGQTPPRFDPKRPTDTVESRFAGTLKGVVELLKAKSE